jgi:ketosteroid isomerase-like protein
MKKFQKAATVSGAALALVLCAIAPSWAAQASAVSAVHAADGAWVKAYNAGQVENIVALYDENAVIYAPGATPVHGRAAIQEFFTKDNAEFMKSGLAFELGANPDGGVSGSIGWSSGTWMLKDKTGQAVDSGWYFSVSRKVGGKWLYVRDSWNSDKPAAPAAAAVK